MATFEDKIVLKDGVSDVIDNINKRVDSLNKKTSTLSSRLRNVGNSMVSFGKRMSLAVTAPIAGAGIVALGFKCVDAASDMNETLSKTEAVFGKEAESIKKWAKSSIESLGLSSQAALESASNYGNMALGIGFSAEKAAQLGQELTQLSSDLSSFNNVSQDIAQTSLKSIFTGETETLKKFGIVMTEANLKLFAREIGIRKNIKRMTEQEKVMLRYKFVLDRTKTAQGDFSRTSEELANSQRILAANQEELSAQLGQVALPIVLMLTRALIKVLSKFNNLSDGTKKTIVVVGLLAAAIPPLIMALGGLAIAFSALAAHPLVLTIMGIVAGFAMLYKWAEKIGEAFGRIVAYWDKIAGAKGISGKIGAFWDVMTGNTENYDRPQQQAVRNITQAQATPRNNTTNNSMNMTFNTSATVRQEADIDKIGQTLVKKFSSAYNNMGNYTPMPAM